MKNIRKVILLIIAGIVIVIQFIPVDRTNPPVTADLWAPEDVKEILKNSCYDCHSNETDWPWYSYVTPVSWLVSNDVNDARRHLNFSDWENMNMSARKKMLDEIWEEIEGGEMPLSIYTFMHSDAKISDEQLKFIFNWTQVAADSIPEN